MIATRAPGMADAGYAAPIFASAVAKVAAGIGTGGFADRAGSYRRPLLVCSALGVAGLPGGGLILALDGRRPSAMLGP